MAYLCTKCKMNHYPGSVAYEKHKQFVSTETAVTLKVSKEAAENIIYALIYSIHSDVHSSEQKRLILSNFLTSLVANNVISEPLSKEVWGYGDLKIKTGLLHPSRYS